MGIYRKVEFLLILACFFICLFLLFENFSLTGFSVFNKEVIYAPSDFIKEKDILVYEDKIVLNIKNYSIEKYGFSDSMVPLFDKKANGIGIKPISEEDINLGDIIIFRKEGNLIIHRVIEKGFDSKGLFFITKGDNNNFIDEKVRFKEIDSVIVGIIY